LELNFIKIFFLISIINLLINLVYYKLLFDISFILFFIKKSLEIITILLCISFLPGIGMMASEDIFEYKKTRKKNVIFNLIKKIGLIIILILFGLLFNEITKQHYSFFNYKLDVFVDVKIAVAMIILMTIGVVKSIIIHIKKHKIFALCYIIVLSINLVIFIDALAKGFGDDNWTNLFKSFGTLFGFGLITYYNALDKIDKEIYKEAKEIIELIKNGSFNCKTKDKRQKMLYYVNGILDWGMCFEDELEKLNLQGIIFKEEYAFNSSKSIEIDSWQIDVEKQFVNVKFNNIKIKNINKSLKK
jgi:hypothetical protein